MRLVVVCVEHQWMQWAQTRKPYPVPVHLIEQVPRVCGDSLHNATVTPTPGRDGHHMHKDPKATFTLQLDCNQRKTCLRNRGLLR